MVALGLGDLTHLLNEAQRLVEVSEAEGALDAVSIIDKLPIRRLHAEAFCLLPGERPDTAATWHAGLCGKTGGHRILRRWP